MITIEKKEIKACCGRSQRVWKLNVPLKKEHLTVLQQAGFPFLRSFYDAGMLHVEDRSLIASGVFGLNELKIRCKNKECQYSLDLLEQTILNKLQ